MTDTKKIIAGIGMDGFSKVQPLREGYLAKGGVNNTSQIKVRPPAPAILPPRGGAPALAVVPEDKPKSRV